MRVRLPFLCRRAAHTPWCYGLVPTVSVGTPDDALRRRPVLLSKTAARHGRRAYRWTRQSDLSDSWDPSHCRYVEPFR